MELPKIPSVKDKIDFSQFVFPNDPSGLCMIHIPYNYFHVFRAQGKQEAYLEFQEVFKKSQKEISKFFEDRIEK